MRRLYWILFALMATRAGAESHHDHSHCEEFLGHHWACPEYIGEIRFQLALMAGLAVAAVMYTIVKRFRRVSRCA